MLTITDKQSCSGCSACYGICPVNCISMQPDFEGFLYPKVDTAKCTGCGLCEKVCPFIHENRSNPKDNAYACKNKDEETRLQSSSGGLFSIFAEYTLNLGGVVFGASFNPDFMVAHTRIESKADLHKLRGSKYVQSDMGDAYKEAQNRLRQGQRVLFSGTPCQIAGLKSFLNRDYENLSCVDLVCHGVPSPKVWKKYITHKEKTEGSAIRRIFFRMKNPGWKKSSISFLFENGLEYRKWYIEDIFMKGFLSDLYLRPSCHHCKANNFRSGSDITLADYWGVHTRFPEFDDDKGTSLVLVNSIQGESLFASLKDKMEAIQTEIAHAWTHNPCMVRCVSPHKNRDIFFRHLDNMEINKLIPKMLRPPILSKLKDLLRRASRKMKKLLLPG